MLHDSSNLLNRLFIRFVSVFVYLIIMGLTAEDINKIIERKIAPLEQSAIFRGEVRIAYQESYCTREGESESQPRKQRPKIPSQYNCQRL